MPRRTSKRKNRRGALRLALAAPLAAVVVACGAAGEGASDGPGGDARSVDGLEVETLAEGLDTPWEVAFAPDGRVLVTERPGRIRVLEDDELREEPYAELPAEETGEGGQLGLTFDPNFDDNGRMYAYYTAAGDGGPVNRVVRLVEEDGEVREDGILLEAPAASIHNGGRVAVGPDGKLYVTLGDVAEVGLAQDRGALAGKIARLELDGSVPDDNPFPGSPVFSYGHRNPQGLAWDDEGNLYAPEHGASGHDELNLIEAGENYGWPEVEGEGGEPEFADPLLGSGRETWGALGGGPLIGGAVGGQRALHRPARSLPPPRHLRPRRPVRGARPPGVPGGRVRQAQDRRARPRWRSVRAHQQ